MTRSLRTAAASSEGRAEGPVVINPIARLLAERQINHARRPVCLLGTLVEEQDFFDDSANRQRIRHKHDRRTSELLLPLKQKGWNHGLPDRA